MKWWHWVLIAAAVIVVSGGVGAFAGGAVFCKATAIGAGVGAGIDIVGGIGITVGQAMESSRQNSERATERESANIRIEANDQEYGLQLETIQQQFNNSRRIESQMQQTNEALHDQNNNLQQEDANKRRIINNLQENNSKKQRQIEASQREIANLRRQRGHSDSSSDDEDITDGNHRFFFNGSRSDHGQSNKSENTDAAGTSNSR